MFFFPTKINYSVTYAIYVNIFKASGNTNELIMAREMQVGILMNLYGSRDASGNTNELIMAREIQVRINILK